MACTNYVKAEYIWIGGRGEVRSKTKIIHGQSSVVLKELPKWNYDGSSTEQAPGTDSEVIIVPRAVYPDPFRKSGSSEHVLVICDTYDAKMKPLPTNSRNLANDIFSQKKDEEPWFGIEQEYVLFQDGRPLGFPKSHARSFGPLQMIGFPGPQGPYYCSAGAGVAFGRDIVEKHLEYCLYAGLKLSGINAEVMPGQWEFQVGPCEGIESGDMMLASRYILIRVAEMYEVVVSFDAKPLQGDWNGSGCHTNYSTKAMREEEGSLEKVIYPALEKLGKRHEQHINSYGGGNDQRLTGKHETAGIGKFSYGVADRGASVRIPNQTKIDGKGYFEDRRPAANMDPYVVTSMIFDTTALDGKNALRFAEVRTEGVDISLKDNSKLPEEEPKLEEKPVEEVKEEIKEEAVKEEIKEEAVKEEIKEEIKEVETTPIPVAKKEEIKEEVEATPIPVAKKEEVKDVKKEAKKEDKDVAALEKLEVEEEKPKEAEKKKKKKGDCVSQ